MTQAMESTGVSNCKTKLAPQAVKFNDHCGPARRYVSVPAAQFKAWIVDEIMRAYDQKGQDEN